VSEGVQGDAEEGDEDIQGDRVKVECLGERRRGQDRE